MKKWFLIIFIWMVAVVSASTKPNVHPYHVGAIEIEYNAASKTYQITAKFFLDDLEDAINLYEKQALFFHKKEHEDLMSKALSKYVRERMLIKSDMQNVSLHFLGYEEEKERVYIYLESEVTSTPNQVTVGVNVLYDLFKDQMNIVHLRVNGQRKSHKLDYPEIYFTQKF